MNDLGMIERAMAAMGIAPPPFFSVIQAQALALAHHPAFPPNSPVFITAVETPDLAARVRQTLLAYYPADHPAWLAQGEAVAETTLAALDASPLLGEAALLYLPALPESTAFEAMQAVVARLRAPDGCPWDRKQTHQSLRGDLLSEAYETLEALDANDIPHLQEELGDLILTILLQTQIASEAGEFRMTDVLDGIHTKIVRRHPHVFGDVQVSDASDVLQNWEKLKAEERRANGEAVEKGLLDGVPLILPALLQAQEVQDRAKRVGFDWDNIEGVIAKVREELDEVLAAKSEAEQAGEIGDLVFAAVNLARWLNVDAESALRASTLRFRRRFAFIEAQARARGRDIHAMSFAEMDALWEAAKDALDGK